MALETVKRVSLELGGKSAFVILPDADLDKAVKIGLANCFINGGQTCTAWTRMLVPAPQRPGVAAPPRRTGCFSCATAASCPPVAFPL